MKAFPAASRSWAVFPVLLLGVCGSTSPVMGADALRPPNILFIMTDDHAAHAMSCYGSVINRTPQLDRIATNGMKFNHCFVVNSICTPSRAAILTGKYSHANGVTVFNRFDGGQPHVAKHLKAAGYQTALVGKWHLFSDPTGFDYWNVLPGQGKYHDPELIEMGVKKVVQGYATDIITDLSIDWLKRRDPGKPFFLCTHHKAPHREWSPDAKHAKLYEDVDIPEPASFNDDYSTRSRAAAEAMMRIDRDFRKTDLKADPPAGLSGQALKKWNYQRYIKDYLRCIASVDDNVGRLLDYLQSSGLGTNTVVIYTSDQGFFLGDHGWYDKRFMYEESLRMPLLVSWPGRIKPGSVNDAMVLNVDFAPTFLALAGQPVPSDMQGRSAEPLLRGERPGDWRTSMYYRYYHYPQDHRVQPHYGVRDERHKLIYFNKLDEWELFDLKNDPRETNNVFRQAAYAGTVKKLQAELARLRSELNDTNQFADGPPTAVPFREVPLELALHYDFAGAANGTVSDASGKGQHGKLQRGQVVAGRKGRALKLDGDGQITVASSRTSLDPDSKPFTVGAWCKPERGDGVILALGGASHGFSLYLKEGVPCLTVRAGGELLVARSTQKLPLNEWTHVVGTLKDTGEVVVFVDGKPAATAPGGAVQSKPADGLSVGADSGSLVGDYTSAQPWHGLLEDVRLYWGELDAEGLKQWSER